MSIKLMAKVWELDVKHPERLVLLALADHADDNGRSVRPSVAYTAWKTGYGVRQVQNIIGRLRAAGVLIIERQANQHKPIEYRLRLAVLPIKAPFPRGVKNAPLPHPGVQNGDARGVIVDSRGARAVAPKSFSTESSKTESLALRAKINGKRIKDLLPPEWQEEFERGRAQVST